jgi:putative methionine-R-sulfoxide reductase with GAF domain
MDRYSILDPGLSTRGAPERLSPDRELAQASLPAVTMPPESVRFPGDDAGRSLTAMAERDLNAALQLLAERAQYITGASGAAIALRQGPQMICRASAGPSAPELGVALQVNSGLSAESVRTRHLLRCDDAENDPRVNRDSCRALGIASVVVMPLVREGEVNGVFELLSDRAYAFEERDIAALERLAEMIQTAVDHAEAARRAEKGLGREPFAPAASLEKPATDRPPAIPSTADAVSEPQASDSRVDDEPILLETLLREAQRKREAEPTRGAAPEDDAQAEPIQLNDRGSIHMCEACGFPVSQGRKLCLDCEAKGVAAGGPDFLSQLSTPRESWFRSHLYLVGTVLVAAATVALLIWFRQ